MRKSKRLLCSLAVFFKFAPKRPIYAYNMKKFKLLSYLILITGFVIVDFSSCTKQV